MELEGVVVMAEDEQVWEPSSDGRGFMVGEPRPPCGEGCLCAGPLASVLGPWGLGQRKTVRNGVARSHAKAGLSPRVLTAEAAGHTNRRENSWAAPRGLWSAQEAQAAGLCWGPREAGLGSKDRSHYEPQAAGRK